MEISPLLRREEISAGGGGIIMNGKVGDSSINKL
jgi:hypothetical protein